MYFAVGRAASLRNDAQTAADAAALAAAQDARDQLREGWLEVILDPRQWDEFLQGRKFVPSAACQVASEFAARNGAELTGSGCVPSSGGLLGFEVTVRTTGTVGRSIVPGTESRHATATAAAVIEPLCAFVPPVEPAPESTPTAPGDAPEDETLPLPVLKCNGNDWDIDPEDPSLPNAVELFAIRLTGDDE